MCCSTLAELPPPPPGRTGWPWTEETAQLPDTMPDGNPWPKITVVTPSYNQGKYLEETLRSVLLQGYPDLEYIVIDGGSTDCSAEIVKKYEPSLAYRLCEPDRGQAEAINKGLVRATGEIFNWINSDDLLLPGTLQAIAAAAEDHHAVAGNVIHFDATGRETLVAQSHLTARGLIYPKVVFQQSGLWLRPSLIRACGGINTNLRYIFDWDLVIRYLAFFPDVTYVDHPVARFRLHSASKTVAEAGGFIAEMPRVVAPLLADARFTSLAGACLLFLRRYFWLHRLEAMRDAPPAPPALRVLRAVRIAILACMDPRVRFCRSTAGTARRTLTGVWEDSETVS